MTNYFLPGWTGMTPLTATKLRRPRQGILPGAFTLILAAWVVLGLSVSVSAQPDNETAGQEGDQEQESNEPPAETPTSRSNRGVIQLESQVIGNQEQPQVFYVVPWQSPESPQLPYDPLRSQLEQVFGHLEREELRRELKQREQFQTDADSNMNEKP